MIEKEKDSGLDNKPSSDSREIFEEIFRDGLDELKGVKSKKKAAPEIGKTPIPKKRKEPPPIKRDRIPEKRSLPKEKPPTSKKREAVPTGKPIKRKSRAWMVLVSTLIPLVLAAIFTYSGLLDFSDLLIALEPLGENNSGTLIKRNLPVDNDKKRPANPSKSIAIKTSEDPDKSGNETITQKNNQGDDDLTGAVVEAGKEIDPRLKPEPNHHEISPIQAELSQGVVDVDKVTVAETETPPLYPYSILLGSFKTVERAERAVSEYRQKGLSPFWVKVDLGGRGVWYRIFTGNFNRIGEAEALISEMEIEGAKPKKTRYAILIGAYKREKTLQEKFHELSELGYSPYIIQGGVDGSRLYIGAFYTKGGAEKQHEDLLSKGVKSRIVER